MKLRQCLVATIGAVALMGTFLPVVIVHSQAQQYLSVEIRGGRPLEAHVSVLHPLNGGNAGIAPDSLVISVLDERGLASGWTVVFETRTAFSLREQPDADPVLPLHQGIEVLQGNPELAGQTVHRFRAGQTTDSLSWTAANRFGDGHYALTLEGTPSPGLAATHTLFTTMCGSAP
jgi:hypothetical protein